MNLERSSLFADRAFGLFFAARAVSIAGSAVTGVVLPILVYQRTGSALNTALVAALEVVPYLLFGLLAGAIADRADRRKLMVWSDGLNALLIASIPVASWFGVLSLTQIYIVTFLSSTLFVWFDTASFGALPALVGKTRILEANNALWGASTVIGIIVPPLGAYLAVQWGAAQTLAVDAGSFALSAVALALVPRAFNGARAAQTNTSSAVKRVSSDIREGLRFLWAHPLIRPMTLLGFGVSFSGGAVYGLLVVFAARDLGLSGTDPRVGWLFTSAAIGALLATLALPRLKNVPSSRIYVWGLAADAALLLLFIASRSVAVALPLYALWNAAHTLIIITGISLRQRVTPEHLQSRVNAAGRMIAWGGTPFGAAVAGVLAEGIGVRTALYITSLAVLSSAALAWRSPLRRSSMDDLGSA